MSTELQVAGTKAVAPPGEGLRALLGAFPIPAVGASGAILGDRSSVEGGTGATGAAAPVDAKSVEEAAGQLSDYVEQLGAELRFRVDEDSGRVVVSVVDTASGDVLLQMPSEEALRLARMLEDGAGTGNGALIATVA